jgi:DNA-binding CsgD family transcriptional regulator
MPHIRRAALIGKTIDLKTMESASMADSLDGIDAGVFIVDASAHIAHANTSGLAMLTDGSLLRSKDGKLAVNDADAGRVLHSFFAAASNGDAAVGARGIAVPLMARHGERYIAHALPLTSGARQRAGIAYAATTAVFVCKTALNLWSPMETVARLYKLTPSEARIMLALVEVGGVPVVSDALGISKATVKTHLNNVFAKTGTHRQTDLVKLIAGYMNPLI